MDRIEHWRPIPNFDNYEISERGRVRRVELLMPGADGEVILRTPEGRRSRSARRLLTEVWGDVVPEVLRTPERSKTPPQTINLSALAASEPRPQLSFEGLAHLQQAKKAPVPPPEVPVALTVEEIQDVLRRFG